MCWHPTLGQLLVQAGPDEVVYDYPVVYSRKCQCAVLVVLACNQCSCCNHCCHHRQQTVALFVLLFCTRGHHHHCYQQHHQVCTHHDAGRAWAQFYAFIMWNADTAFLRSLRKAAGTRIPALLRQLRLACFVAWRTMVCWPNVKSRNSLHDFCLVPRHAS